MRTTEVLVGFGIVAASLIGTAVVASADAPDPKVGARVVSAAEVLAPAELTRQQSQAPLMAIANEVSVLVQPYASQQLGGLSLTPTSVKVAWKGTVPAALAQAQVRYGSALQIVGAKFSQADLVAASQRIGSASGTPFSVALSSDGTGLTIEAPAAAHAALGSAIATERASGMVIELTTPAPNAHPALD